MVGQGPAAGAGRVAVFFCFVFLFFVVVVFSSRLSYLLCLASHLLGDGWIY